MKAILKTLLFLLTVVILIQCKKDIEPSIVTITDNNFLNALIELGVDTNGDGIISPTEAEVITLGPSSAYEFPDLNISQMPTLYQVCVWEIPFPPAGVSVYTTNSPNVYFTTDCN